MGMLITHLSSLRTIGTSVVLLLSVTKVLPTLQKTIQMQHAYIRILKSSKRTLPLNCTGGILSMVSIHY